MRHKETKHLFNTFLTVGAMAAAALGCGCDKTSEPPVVDPVKGSIHYTFNWEKILPGCSIPDSLHYCFYPLHGGPMLQIESDSKGLRFALAPDDYQLLIFNCDANNILFANMDTYATAEARLLPVTKAGENLPSAAPLYGIAIDSLSIRANQRVEQEYVPHPLVQRVSFNVKVDGMQYIKECEGTLSGVASTLNLSKQSILPGNPARVSFQTERTESGIAGNVFILGAPKKKDPEQDPGEQPKPESHQVIFDFTLVNGNTISSTVDLGHTLTENENDLAHDVVVDMDVVVEVGATFSITLKSWTVGTGDNTTIE